MCPKVYELPEAAAKIKFSERVLANGLRAGDFPGRKAGRKWLLTDDDLEAILQICARPAMAPPSTDYANPVASQRSSMTPTTARRIRGP